MEYLEYPKWVEVAGNGSDHYPGHEIANDAEHEAELTGAKRRGRPPKAAQGEEPVEE